MLAWMAESQGRKAKPTDPFAFGMGKTHTKHHARTWPTQFATAKVALFDHPTKFSLNYFS